MSGQFVHHDLGHRHGGEIVEITLSGNSANVRLMDSSNFSSYRRGGRHQFIGGRAVRSPVRLQVPRTGHWHVAVDLQGVGGRVNSSARVLPGMLPAISEAPLSSAPSLVRQEAPQDID